MSESPDAVQATICAQDPAARTALAEHGDLALSVAYFDRFDVPRDARILDLGTRFGSFLQALDMRGYGEIQGLDIDADAIETGRRTYPHLADRLHLYDGVSLQLAPESLDVITAFDVLEHIPDLPRFLTRLLPALRPGGRMIFQTPNRYINIPWEILQHRSLTEWRKFHCSLQSLGSLRRILKQGGFGSISIEKFDRPSDFKDHHARQKLGPLGPVAIRLARRMPLPLYPNFWGHARRPDRGA